MEIKIGDKVRSFDFSPNKDLEGDRACYIEGTVIDLGMVKEGCPRYEIKVEKRIFGGEVIAEAEDMVYPPINGTPTRFGRPTDYVEIIK